MTTNGSGRRRANAERPRVQIECVTKTSDHRDARQSARLLLGELALLLHRQGFAVSRIADLLGMTEDEVLGAGWFALRRRNGIG